MKKICVYTCITGHYDNLHEINISDKNVDFICYTNNEELKSNTWEIIYVSDKNLNDHQLSRKIKILGTEYINKNYDISVWQDATVSWKLPPSKFVEENFSGVFSAFVHNERASVFDEANEVIKLRKDNKKNVMEHIKFLKKEGFPDDLGLYEMTVFIKRNNNPVVKDTMRVWYETYLKYTKRDQLSFMYAIWKTQLNITPIKMNVWNNKWVKHFRHNYKEEITDCRIYFTENSDASAINYVKDYKYKTNKDTYSVTTKVPIDTNTIEIEASDVPCVRYDDIKINCKCDSVQVFNTIPFEDHNIFYNNKGILIVKGNFKKGKQFTFSIRLNRLNDFDKYNLIERLGTDLITASEDIEILKNQKQELKNTIDDQSYLIQHPIRNFLCYIKNAIFKNKKV